jgi:hypothetical protein
MKTPATPHELQLYGALRALALVSAPDLREGRMFGVPALFVGRRMAACVLGAEVGLRVPAKLAEFARASGRARAFTPYGKAPMREWIALDLTPDRLAEADGLIAAALDFARRNNADRS